MRFSWFILDAPQLSAEANRLISDPNNDIEVSPASYWEIAIKIQLGKYSLPQPYQSFVETPIFANHIKILPIQPKHTSRLTTMA